MIIPSLSSVAVQKFDEADADTLRGLVKQWESKQRRNLIRQGYADGKNRLRDLGISLPPQLRAVETVVGWPAKSVDLLAQRIRFDGFVMPGDEQDPYDVQSILTVNRFDVELPQAIRSSLTMSPAMVATVQGDVQSGEPEVLMSFRSALFATGIWDRRRRELASALSIASVNEDGIPNEMVLYLPDRVGVIERQAGRYVVVWRRNPLGRVPVEPLVYHPDLDRPFGRSRISRAVMSITDSAVRTVLRTEVSAEFYAAPQRYVLGADEAAFQDPDGNPVPAWQAVLGRMLAMGRDEDGNVPTVGQFAQQSMQPHTEMLRSLASQFAGETGIPVSSLGVIQDNPSSAEAIHAAREDLIVEAESAAPVYGASLTRAMQNAVMLRDGLSAVPDDLARVQAKWKKADRPSIVSASDAIVKQVSAIPWLAETEVVLEELGYDQATITRLLSDKRRSQSSAFASMILPPANDANAV